MKSRLIHGFHSILIVILVSPCIAATTTIFTDGGNCKVLDQDIALEYQGQCVDGFADGPGVARGKDSYRGFFRAGRQDGAGEYVWASGQRYVGQFKDGRPDGKGTMYYPTGLRIEATFGKGNAIGEGILVDAKGDRYRFDFDNKKVISREDKQSGDDQNNSEIVGSTISVIYRPPSKSQQSRIYAFAKTSKILESASARVMKSLNLSNPPKVLAATCNQVNAFYSPATQTITVCYELLELAFLQISDDFKYGRESYDWFEGKAPSKIQIANFSSGLIDYVFFHEFGHALVHLLKLPILGKEEDAADQASIYLLLKEHSSTDMLKGALWFNRGSRIFSSRNDTHTWGPQRQVNIACWAFGGNPKQFAPLLRIANVSSERAKQCSYEFHRIESSVQKLLGRNLK